MFDMFYFEDEIGIDDINEINYDDFIKHETILYVKTNLSKKQLHNFRRKMKDKSFYPIHIIRQSDNDTEQIQQHKLEYIQQENEKLFKERYRQIVKQQFNINSLFNNSEKIKKCPFCHKNKLIISHNYTANNTDYTLLFKCNSCNQILDTKPFIRVFDASYIYSETINDYFNLYCKNYGNELIEKKIFEELKSTETIGFLGFQ